VFGVSPADLPIIKDVLEAASILNTKWKVISRNNFTALTLILLRFYLFLNTMCCVLLILAEATRIGLYHCLWYPFRPGEDLYFYEFCNSN